MTAAVALRSIGLGLRPTLVAAELALAGPALLATIHYRVPPSAGLLWRPLRLPSLAAALLTGAALWTLSLGVLELQSAVWPPPNDYIEGYRRLHALLRPSDPLDACLSVLAIAVAPALAEEVVFRGALLSSLLKFGPSLAVGTTSLLFGLIHVDPSDGGLTLYRVPFAIVVGLVLALLRARAGSLAAPMAAHAFVNTLTFVIAPLVDDPSQAIPQAEPLKGAAFALAGLLATAGLLRYFPARASSSGV
jgi:membrane protease YdiL (CAAX protease family)